ncbi:MAG: FadR family transcriptional regulator [Chloroflexi bacterium]|nr:FadR family transcriptional regulator [Chloroflexota bacterium]
MFRPVPNVRLSDSAARQILELIKEGELKIGDQLPAQRELVNQLEVSRTALREGVRTLEAIGMLKTIPGRGTFVHSVTPLSSVASSLALWLLEHKQEVMDVLDVREAIESKAAQLAAERATPAQIEAMESCLSEMQRCAQEEDLKGVTQLDARFHGLLSQSTQNAFLIGLTNSITEAIAHSRSAIFELPGRPLKSLSEHWEILRAIQRRDAKGAIEAMLIHLQDVKREILEMRSP